MNPARPCYIPDLTATSASLVDATATLRVNRLEFEGAEDHLATSVPLTTGMLVELTVGGIDK